MRPWQNNPTTKDRYVLAEKNIVDQVNYRDNLLAEQKIMGDKIRDLEQQRAESRLNPELTKSLNTPKFILQIPGIKENYKLHLDFGEVKGLSDLDSTEYHGSKILLLYRSNTLVQMYLRICWVSMRYTSSGSTFHRRPLMLLCATLSRCSCSRYKHRGVLHLTNGTASFRSRLKT